MARVVHVDAPGVGVLNSHAGIDRTGLIVRIISRT